MRKVRKGKVMADNRVRHPFPKGVSAENLTGAHLFKG